MSPSRYINANVSKYGMRLQYSTPTFYMKTLHAKDHAWPLKRDDFEPYAIGPDQFLVGFYSSRPDMKGLIRQCSAQLRAAHAALANALLLGPPGAKAKLKAKAEVQALGVQSQALGVLQHHDAITSSQRRHVHRDYVKSLSVGQSSVDAALTRILGATLTAGHTRPGNVVAPVLVTCPHLNESACAATTSPTSGVTAVVLQNPTAQPMQGVPVKIPVGHSAVSVTRGADQVVVAQLLPAWPQAPIWHNVTSVKPSPTVIFLAEVPALGTATYFIHHGASNGKMAQASSAATPQTGITLNNGIVTAEFDKTGLLMRLTKGNTSVAVKQTLRYYDASDGAAGPNNPYKAQGAGGSGNYIFQPDGGATHTFTPTGTPEQVSHISGAVVSEVRHIYVRQRIEQVFRLFNGSDTLEIEYRIGAIDISDGKGKEVLSHFETDIRNGDEWASDVNGMQIDVRKRDTRATLWPGGPEYFNQTDGVAGNYFAANTLAFIADTGNVTHTAAADTSTGVVTTLRSSVPRSVTVTRLVLEQFFFLSVGTVD
jgi:lysosomal alpha-mannosidase